MMNDDENSKFLESIIKIEAEQILVPNEKRFQWTSADEILRKKAKIFSDPKVLLENIQWKKMKKPSLKRESITNELAKKYNPGLNYWDPHTCHLCSKVCSLRSILAKHLSTKHGFSSEMFCDHCTKTYFDKYALQQHMRNHMKKCLTCNVCDFKTADRSILRIHKLTHVKNEKCKICDKQVTSLRMHMISHAPKEICPICGQQQTKYKLKSHMKMHKNHKCKQCNGNFKNSEDLRRHNLRSHHPGPIFECHCGSVFKNKLLLYTHKLKHKNGKVTCNVCGKIYAYETGFRRHWKEQHFETLGPVRNKVRGIHRPSAALNHSSPHTCDLCGRKYSNRLVFRNHINKIHLYPKTYFCDLCPKTFKIKSAIPVHMRDVHFPVEKQRCFSCDKCGFKSKFKGTLKTHLLKKSCRSECKICHRKVKNMAQHMTKHGKVKCPTCGKAMRKTSLAPHLKLHSSIKKMKAETNKI